MSNDFAAGVWGFFASCVAPCPPAPGPPAPHRPCPPGRHVDAVPDPGDNGSCDCDTFCASDWTGAVRTARRPHWQGVASAEPGATTDSLDGGLTAYSIPDRRACKQRRKLPTLGYLCHA
eukprot:gene7288-biopygen5894